MDKDQESPRRSRRRRISEEPGQGLGRDTGDQIDWADALSGIRASFDWLCAWPHPVRVDGGRIPGLPDALIPLDEVRQRLTTRGCPLHVSDGVWAHLAARSRVDGPSWTVASAGMALPMLCHVVKLLSDRFADDRSDIASATVVGFLGGLAVLDINGSRLFASLRWSAYRAGLAAVHHALAAPEPTTEDWLTELAFTAPGRVSSRRTPRRPSHVPARGQARVAEHTDPTGPTGHVGGAEREDVADREDRVVAAASAAGPFESSPPPAVVGHPDLVLARAVRDGVLSFAEAAMIGATRLETLTIADAAAARGQSITAATVSRHRAERRLLHYLTSPDMLGGEGAPRTPPPSSARRERAHPSDTSTRRTRTRKSRSATDGAGSDRTPPTSDPLRNRQATSPAVSGQGSAPVGIHRAHRSASASASASTDGPDLSARAVAEGASDTPRSGTETAADNAPVGRTAGATARVRQPSPRDLDPAWRTHRAGTTTTARPTAGAADVDVEPEPAAQTSVVSVVTR